MGLMYFYVFFCFFSIFENILYYLNICIFIFVVLKMSNFMLLIENIINCSVVFYSNDHLYKDAHIALFYSLTNSTNELCLVHR